MIIDLCSGLGRWPDDEAISIDFDIKTKPTILADVRFLPLRQNVRPELCHSSPPCRYFSQGRFHKHGYDEQGLAESFRIVAACFDAFAWLQPKTWTLENPRGVLRRILPPSCTIEYAAYDLKHKTTDFYSNRKSLRRAMIPKDVRQLIMDNIEWTNPTDNKSD